MPLPQPDLPDGSRSVMQRQRLDPDDVRRAKPSHRAACRGSSAGMRPGWRRTPVPLQAQPARSSDGVGQYGAIRRERLPDEPIEASRAVRARSAPCQRRTMQATRPSPLGAEQGAGGLSAQTVFAGIPVRSRPRSKHGATPRETARRPPRQRRRYCRPALLRPAPPVAPRFPDVVKQGDWVEHLERRRERLLWRITDGGVDLQQRRPEHAHWRHRTRPEIENGRSSSATSPHD